MSKQGRQFGDGFRVLRKSADTPATIKLPVAASTSITKGDMVELSSGYAQGATAFSLATKGIAQETVDNSSGAAGAKNVLIVPLSEELQLLVQVEADALVTQAAVGTVIDLETDVLGEFHYTIEFNDSAGLNGISDEVIITILLIPTTTSDSSTTTEPLTTEPSSSEPSTTIPTTETSSTEPPSSETSTSNPVLTTTETVSSLNF